MPPKRVRYSIGRILFLLIVGFMTFCFLLTHVTLQWIRSSSWRDIPAIVWWYSSIIVGFTLFFLFLIALLFIFMRKFALTGGV